MKSLPRIKLCIAAAFAASAANAQAIKPPHPADASAPVPAARYESAFAGYASFRNEKLAPWRDVNDEVARAGGHIGILRGAATATKPAPGAKPR